MIAIKRYLAAQLPKLVLAPSGMVIVVAIYGFIAWTASVSLSSSKVMPIYDFVGLEQYVRLWSRSQRCLATASRPTRR